MAPAARVYTPAEAAAVTGIAIKAVNNALDQQVLGTRRSQGRRTLTGEDVLLLKVWHGVGSALARESRNALFDAIRAKPGAERVRAGDLLIVDIAAARRQIKARLKDLAEAEAAVHCVERLMGGEPGLQGNAHPGPCDRQYAAGWSEGRGASRRLSEHGPTASRFGDDLVGCPSFTRTAPEHGRLRLCSQVYQARAFGRHFGSLCKRRDREVKFLFDECLHPSLVAVAISQGQEAYHLNWRGLRGRQIET